MRVVITGASGLVGTFAALRFLEMGYDVTCHRNNSPIPAELTDKNLHWIQGDIREQETILKLIEKADIIIHTAAVVSFDKSDVERMNAINIGGTKLLVDHLIGTDIKLIHVSSISALGRVDKGKMVDETVSFDEKLKNSPYGKSKFLSEMEVHRAIAEGMQGMIVLPSIILGSNKRNSSSSTLWDQILKMPRFAPAGANGFVDVADVVESIVACLKHWKNGEKYIVNGHNVEYIDLYKKVLKFKGKKTQPKKIHPSFLLVMLPFVKLFYFLTNTHSKVSKDSIITTSQSFTYDNSKSIEDLKLSYTSLDTSVSNYV